MTRSENTDLFKKIILHPEHVYFLIAGLVSLDYIQSVIFLDMYNPGLEIIIPCRYLSWFVVACYFLKSGAKNITKILGALLLPDILFFLMKSDLLINSSGLMSIKIAFFAKAAASILYALSAYAIAYFCHLGIVLELVTYGCFMLVMIMHNYFQGIGVYWFKVVKSILMNFELSEANMNLIAKTWSVSMTSNMVNGYLLVPFISIIIVASYWFGHCKERGSDKYLKQWLSYKISWFAFSVSMFFYIIGYGAIWFGSWFFAEGLSWQETGFIGYCFDIIQFVPCAAGLSISHCMVNTYYRNKKKRSGYRATVFIMYILFYLFHHAYVFLGLCDRVLDLRKKYRLKHC